MLKLSDKIKSLPEDRQEKLHRRLEELEQELMDFLDKGYALSKRSETIDEYDDSED